MVCTYRKQNYCWQGNWITSQRAEVVNNEIRKFRFREAISDREEILIAWVFGPAKLWPSKCVLESNNGQLKATLENSHAR